jgi:hypothetical protein
MSLTGYTFKTAKSVSEVEQLRVTWETLQNNSNKDFRSDINYFLNEINSRADTVLPHVITIYEDTVPKTLIIGWIEDIRLAFRFGYKVLPGPKVRSLTVAYHGILGETSHSICSELILKLINFLSECNADLVLFQGLKTDSYMYNISTKLPSFCCRDHLPWVRPHWRLFLPESYATFLSRLSPSRRANVNILSNRMHKKYGQALTVKCVSNKNDIEVLLRDIETVAQKTWQRALGGGYFNNHITHRRYELALEREWLRAYLLYIDKNPIAFWTGYCYGNTFFIEHTGFDPVYRHSRPGTVLLMIIIKELCNDVRIDVIDFAPGSEEYKKIYGNQSCREAHVYIYAPTLQGILINAIKTSSNGLSLLSKRFIKGLHLEGTILRYWRKHL